MKKTWCNRSSSEEWKQIMRLGFVNSTAMLENKSSKSPDLLRGIMPERTSVNVLRATKDTLDSIKHPGQSYDGIIQELAEFWQEKRKEYWTRIQEQRRTSKRG